MQQQMKSKESYPSQKSVVQTMGYKQTEIGVIPSDWEVKELGEICFPSKSRINPITSNVNYKCIELEHLSQGSGILLGYTNSKDLLSQKSVFEKGDVLFGKLRPYLRKFLLAEFDGVCTTEIWVLKTQNETANNFLYQLVQSEKIVEAANLSTGTKMPRAEWKTVSETKIPVPTLTEQTLIATALSDADALISSLEKLIAKKRNIKQGAMQKCLNPDFYDLDDDLDLTEEEKSQKSINQKNHSSDKWEVKKLGEVAFVNMGQSPLSQFYNSEGIGLPLVQGNADVENRKTIIRFYTSMITKKGKVGDIIMSVRAPVGEISKATFDCCLGRGVCSVSFDNEYLYHYLIYFEKSWAKLSTGSTFDSVNSKQVKELEIPLPKSKEEQTRIANMLSEMDNEITALETKLEKYKKVKLGMMQNLLTGKIRLV